MNYILLTVDKWMVAGGISDMLALYPMIRSYEDNNLLLIANYSDTYVCISIFRCGIKKRLICS